MFNLFQDVKIPLGLDISDLSLKLMQFQRTGDRLAVQAYQDTNIPKEVLSGDKIKDPKLLKEILKQALVSPVYGRFTGSYVVASIPETKSFVRVIQMPAMSEAEASEAVPWEAEAYIPLPISQVYLDWLIIGKEKGKEKEEAKMTVLIMAAPRDYVDDFVGVLTEAGLTPLALEVESQATARSLIPASKKDEAILIADIDAVRTSLIINDRGTLQFTSSLPIAGEAFTESIAHALDLDFAEAEKLKRAVGIDANAENGKVKKALSSVVNNLVEEIKNTIRFYEEHSTEASKISHLVLTGGSSKLKHLPSFLHDKLTHRPFPDHPLRSLPGIKVELGNPWVNLLKKGQTPPLSREESLSYSTAIGLALREMII